MPRLTMRCWLDSDLVILNGVVWTKGKARKPWQCGFCSRSIEKGGVAWRPLTERPGIPRSERACTACVGPAGETNQVELVD